MGRENKREVELILVHFRDLTYGRASNLASRRGVLRCWAPPADARPAKLGEPGPHYHPGADMWFSFQLSHIPVAAPTLGLSVLGYATFCLQPMYLGSRVWITPVVNYKCGTLETPDYVVIRATYSVEDFDQRIRRLHGQDESSDGHGTLG